MTATTDNHEMRDQHIATLERMREDAFHLDLNNEDIAALDAAIALMRGQSDKPRAYFCPMDYGPGMLMHNDETATAMMAYFIPKGQTFIPLYEGQPLPATPKDSADEQ